MPLKVEDFQYIAEIARQNAAIVIEAGKEYLVETRLEPLARQEGFGSLEALITQVRLHKGFGPLHAKIVDALTTNETFFFRDFHPFEAMRLKVLPGLIGARAAARKLTIWSAACSSGQEPYSLAMMIREHFPQLRDWSVKILATDLSPTILGQARAGRYTQLQVNRGLPAIYLVKYFVQKDGAWHIKDDIKAMIEFREMNLAQPWPMLPAFDVVFLRNVMIYFDIETKKSILRRLRACTLAHSHLFLGTAETTMNLDTGWKPANLGTAVAYQHATAA